MIFSFCILCFQDFIFWSTYAPHYKWKNSSSLSPRAMVRLLLNCHYFWRMEKKSWSWKSFMTSLFENWKLTTVVQFSQQYWRRVGSYSCISQIESFSILNHCVEQNVILFLFVEGKSDVFSKWKMKIFPNRLLVMRNFNTVFI